jgi:hypothetical protein
LERLRNSNPAARCLPLFMAIAGRDRQDVILPYLFENGLTVEVTPCE